jgi:hypothetical protein
MRLSLIGKQHPRRFFICKIDDGSSLKPLHPKVNHKLVAEAILGTNVTENS